MTRRRVSDLVPVVRARWGQVRGQAEAGFVSLYVVVITVGLLAMAGLVIDGGDAIAAREQAVDAAQQASRAGADALTPESLRGSPTGLTASPAAAQAAANRILATSGVTGTVSVDGDNVTVTGRGAQEHHDPCGGRRQRHQRQSNRDGDRPHGTTTGGS